jgi:hypothetical protein
MEENTYNHIAIRDRNYYIHHLILENTNICNDIIEHIIMKYLNIRIELSDELIKSAKWFNKMMLRERFLKYQEENSHWSTGRSSNSHANILKYQD